jgi:hypothetical protein
VHPSTVKKDPHRTPSSSFARAGQANQVLSRHRAATKRQFVSVNIDRAVNLPLDLNSKEEMFALEIAMRLSGYEKDVI